MTSIRVSLKNEQGKELCWWKAEKLGHGYMMKLDGVEFRNALIDEGVPPRVQSGLWLEGVIEIEVL